MACIKKSRTTIRLEMVAFKSFDMMLILQVFAYMELLLPFPVLCLGCQTSNDGIRIRFDIVQLQN